MPPIRSKRIYNPLALETWFENVTFDWETSFSKETLKEGQTIYREGLISGLELDKDEAIVHCSFERKNTCYSVIEWSNSGPTVRSSTEDSQIGRAVAVAGLYEIEELIADEIPPLCERPKKQPDRNAAPATANEPRTPLGQALLPDKKKREKDPSNHAASKETALSSPALKAYQPAFVSWLTGSARICRRSRRSTRHKRSH